MAKIRWTEEATNWLQDIYEFISEDNPTVAQKVVEEIYENVIEILGVFHGALTIEKYIKQ